MKSSTAEILPLLGTSMGGGFYAGRIRIEEQVFALIVAPRAQGEVSDMKWIARNKSVPGAMSYFDGLANTKAMADAGSRLAKWAQALRVADAAAKLADTCTVKATSAHKAVTAWLQIADALSPEGIPGEMLAAALEPINDRLQRSATDAEWLRAEVGADMSVTGDSRPYALLSESEKWRVDAMLAEAVSYLSKLGLVVLDRFDCLDLQGRTDLLAWLELLADEGEIQSALIFGTLKALPTGLPECVEACWIEGGVVSNLLKEAA